MARAGKPLDQWQIDACELMMAVRDDHWACADYAEWVARQNGKGGLLEARALAGFLLFGEELIAWSAHEYKTAMEAFRRVKSLMKSLGVEVGPNLIDIDGILVKVSNTNGEESFERLDTGARIKFIARSKGSGRGFTAATQFIDEAFAYTSAHQEALAPTTLAVADEQTIYMSTPPLSGDTAAPMYALRARAEAGGDDSLGYRDWGLGGWLEGIDDPATRVDVDDRQNWAATCPALGIRITEARLLRLRRKLGKVGFCREVFGVWPKQVITTGGGINFDMWSSLADPGSTFEGIPSFAIDMPWNRSSVAIAAAGVRADGKRHVELVQVREGTSWAVPWMAERAAKWQPCIVTVDANGPAASLIPELETALAEIGATIVKVNAPEMSQACGAFYDDIVADELRHLGDARLQQALSGAVRSDRGDIWRWDRKDSKADIAPLVAATLARHGRMVYGATYDLSKSFW